MHWARQVAENVVAAHSRVLLRRREGCARVLDLDDQIAAGPRPAGAEEEGPLAAEARDHIQASVVGVQLVRQEGRVDELACLSPGLGNDVHFCDEGSVHSQRAVVDREGGILRGETGSRACPRGPCTAMVGPQASILMLTAKPGAEWKLYVALWRSTREREYGLRGSFPTQCTLARCVRESQHGRHGQSAGGGP